MSGADGSTGKMSASTWQYSMVSPLTTLVMTDVDATRPPVVGRLMTDAGMLIRASPAHPGTVVAWPASVEVVAVAAEIPRNWVAPASSATVATTASRRLLVPLADGLLTLASSPSLVGMGKPVLPVRPFAGGGRPA